ncbi:hypothetical protein KJ032_26880, partial [Salmonella enterica subsp. enterica serovar Typhimurium]|nr:hypothetical protein [Salmonella enterica subsp. enterica serovar Typhimurium]
LSWRSFSQLLESFYYAKGLVAFSKTKVNHFQLTMSVLKRHQMKEELLLQYFYERLLPIECQMLDASAG